MVLLGFSGGHSEFFCNLTDRLRASRKFSPQLRLHFDGDTIEVPGMLNHDGLRMQQQYPTTRQEFAGHSGGADQTESKDPLSLKATPKTMNLDCFQKSRLFKTRKGLYHNRYRVRLRLILRANHVNQVCYPTDQPSRRLPS